MTVTRIPSRRKSMVLFRQTYVPRTIRVLSDCRPGELREQSAYCLKCICLLCALRRQVRFIAACASSVQAQACGQAGPRAAAPDVGLAAAGSAVAAARPALAATAPAAPAAVAACAMVVVAGAVAA